MASKCYFQRKWKDLHPSLAVCPCTGVVWIVVMDDGFRIVLGLYVHSDLPPPSKDTAAHCSLESTMRGSSADETPLLGKPTRKKGFGKLFQRPKPLPPVKNRSHAPQTPPPALRENTRDSQKKKRPFPVPVRKVQSNPQAQDPPESTEVPIVPVQEALPLNHNNNETKDLLLSPIDEKKEQESEAPAWLTRPFGRQSEIGQWIVQVDSPEWDDQVWRYRVLVQRRQASVASFTTALTFRTLHDFLWLEKGLAHEYGGGLLVPLLSVAIGRVESMDSPVEATKLQDWLGDVLNGIRGQGELILPTVDWMESETMEAFLYKNSLVDDDDDEEVVRSPDESTTGLESMWQALWQRLPLEICTGPAPVSETARNGKIALGMMTCSSQGLGTAPSLDVMDSLAENRSLTSGPLSSSLVVHSELIEAERDLLLGYRKRALSTLEKLQTLKQREVEIGVAWKQLAVSLGSLFAYEKDVENAKIGGTRIAKERMPFRKVSKSAVEECLAALATCKEDRSTIPLSTIDEMITAYVADLSSVDPSIDAYRQSMMSQAQLLEEHAKYTIAARRPSGTTNSNCATTQPNLPEALLENERLLRDSLTTLCKSSQTRALRMAWTYVHQEAAQCTKLNAIAKTLQRQQKAVSKDALSEMIKGHMNEEQADRTAEIAAIQRLISIGSHTRYGGSEQSDEVEVGSDAHDEESTRGTLRDRALQLARERVGRWDVKLSLAILEALGLNDASVNVDDATRELRLVQQHANGLRERVASCVESVKALQRLSSGNDAEKKVSVCELRAAFSDELCLLFSGQPTEGQSSRTAKHAMPSLSVLKRAGISVSDSGGWARGSHGDGHLGKMMHAAQSRQSSLYDWLLDRILELLGDYVTRVEIIQGYVFMECVASQVEKVFNKRRVETLSTFEKKTDLSSALNVARRKRLPQLVTELENKLAAMGPGGTHTQVKETKEAHLESKAIKASLHELAVRRLTRARESSTEQVLEMLEIWAKEEALDASRDMKRLGPLQDAVTTSAANK